MIILCVGASPASAAIRVRPATGTTDLNAVACASPRSCVAVGGAGAFPNAVAVVVRASGGRPGPAQPVGSAGGGLGGVACEDQTSCFGVGQTELAPNSSVVPITGGAPAAGTPVGGIADAISCVGHSCLVVGYTFNDSPAQAVATPLNDGIPGQTVIGAPFVELSRGVDCVTPTDCLTVGSNGSDGVLAIANGVPGTPTPISGSSVLSAISCPNQHRCVATGSGSNGQGVFVRIHHGVPRRLRYVPGTVALNGISCPNLVRCFAVGNSAAPEGIIITLP